IEYAEPLYYHTLDVSPNDSLFIQQTHVPVIGLPDAWNRVQGGQGSAVIAIVDGGTEISHQDLHSNLWVNENEIIGNDRDDDGNGYVDDVHGWNFATNSGDPTGLPTQPDFANHGTHTAGIADAVTDNLHGIAGAAWNCRLMAINAADRFGEGIAYGYRAILYAAENGADIINCSWGRGGSPSQYEQDVIDYVTDLGAVVVASAGNSGSTTLNYPACYSNVFAVAATNDWDTKTSFSTYGDWVDISAPGLLIYSTISHNSYARYSGTSMSAPLAAGVMALIKTQRPDWSGRQCAEQVRATAVSIDHLNPSYAGMLGKGRIHAGRAVSEHPPSIRLSGVELVGDDGDSQFRPGETVNIYLTCTNYLAPSATIALSLNENSPYVSLLNTEVTMPGLGTLASATQTTPFQVKISDDAPANQVVCCTVTIAAGDYIDTDHFNFTISANFVPLSINRIHTSVTAAGRIGYASPAAASGGMGFTYQAGKNLLYEGSIIAGVSATQISSSARSATAVPDQDFVQLAAEPLTLFRPGSLTDEESTLSLTDDHANAPMNLAVRQHTFASMTAGAEDFIILRYWITNQGAQTLSNFHFGLFFDWDVDEEHSDANRVNYDAGRRLGYVYNATGEPGTYVGCALLSEGDVSYRAILNDELAPGNPGWGIYDGFSDAEKWEAISSGTAIHQAGIGDVSQVIAAGPYKIQSQQTISVDFALLAGDNLAALQVHTDKANEFRHQFLMTVPDSAVLHLKSGWNLVSSWIAPKDSLLENLLAPLAGKLVLFKDGYGNSYWPDYQIDLLHFWDWRKGYWVYLNTAGDLIFRGQMVSGEKASLELCQGWNLVSYLNESPMAIEQVLTSIAHAVIIVKDGAGRVYWPEHAINTIGDMKPGSGYFLYLAAAATLEWPQDGS
ncbi:S8 family serine peptidase, partial [bacterium]|nr:S8 family serine peptidase [bacterium]